MISNNEDKLHTYNIIIYYVALYQCVISRFRQLVHSEDPPGIQHVTIIIICAQQDVFCYFISCIPQVPANEPLLFVIQFKVQEGRGVGLFAGTCANTP